ncbi:MAG: dienelactone hydrolase family protein [Deltaproteobacteria bacterium]|nr:dienelactone hydrolase family protein [Myxococcales bacterium]MDP3215346.1 dienelactone hydrolase family protein [Deltaproteobacteria bacterium]
MRDREATIRGDAAHGDTPSPVYAHVPAGATRGGVVVHEIFGRQPDIERVVDRFATRGYAAVAPDLFHQGALPCIRAVFAAMRSGEEVAPVRQAQNAAASFHETITAGASSRRNPRMSASSVVNGRRQSACGARRHSQSSMPSTAVAAQE